MNTWRDAEYDNEVMHETRSLTQVGVSHMRPQPVTKPASTMLDALGEQLHPRAPLAGYLGSLVSAEEPHPWL